tara:strand:+ start:1895 stop:2068 length:174 start_codon:yes stop_codon:yes gene_type:complete
MAKKQETYYVSKAEDTEEQPTHAELEAAGQLRLPLGDEPLTLFQRIQRDLKAFFEGK